VIHQLEARDLVARVPSLLDRRSHSLRVTAHGRQALRRMERLVLRHEAEFASVLTPEERETLIRLLVRLYDRRDGEARRPRGTTRIRGSER
jgi:DNA-binding MarR family transcriptional regulator